MDELSLALHSGFIDKEIVATEEYKPRFLYNDHSEGKRLSDELSLLLKECDTFFLSIVL